MSKLNHIGLDNLKSKELAGLLDELLSHYSVLYQNTRGYHWNIKGEKFFELHLKFEELYNNLFVKIDEIAERILTLGYAPQHKYSRYLDSSEIRESDKVTNGIEAVSEIINAFQILLVRQRKILELAAEIGDEGTNALMSDYIREQEKLVWMYTAFLGK